jgi:hypothetical protein
MVPSMLELIFFYILQKIIQGYDSYFVCARVMVFSGMHQQNFAGAGLLCTGGTFDLKNAPAKFMMQSCEFFPPQRRRQRRQMWQQSLQGYRRDNDNDNNGGRQRRRQCPTTAAAAAATAAAAAAQQLAVRDQSAATKGECQITLKSQANIFWT